MGNVGFRALLSRALLLAQLLGLLVAFIGEDLTLRLVREVWPKLSLNDLDLGTGDKNEAHQEIEWMNLWEMCRYMTIGENTLAPDAFTAFCLRKPERCASSDHVQQITLDNDKLQQLIRVNIAVRII
jgi:predicted transglutaminase-like cysteine proteinase